MRTWVLCCAAFVAFAACRRTPLVTIAPATTTAAATTVTAAAVKTYAIRLKRPSHVGDTARIAVDAEHDEHTTARVAGTSKEKQKKTVAHIEGTSKVMALQADGATPLRDEVTVGEFWSMVDGGAKTTLASPGARVDVLRAATKRDARVTVDGRAASQKVLDAIADLTTLTLRKGATDDEVFGTSVPQPVGGEWPINAEAAARDFRARDIALAPGGVTGSTKLVAVRAVHGVDCLEIDNHATLAGIDSLGDLPPGSTVKNGRIDVHLHEMLPIDETKGAIEQEMDITVTGAFVVPKAAGPVEVEVESVDRKRATVLP
ncbi:MAG TPA: hypothetical protein VGH28_06200 [Polyangiaceae bacterium]|jgi:hypothetical protein